MAAAGLGLPVSEAAVRGGPCLWLFSPYLVRELHANVFGTSGASKRRWLGGGGEWGGGGWHRGGGHGTNNQGGINRRTAALPLPLPDARRRLLEEAAAWRSGTATNRWVPLLALALFGFHAGCKEAAELGG